jgi:hypothetical protein
VRKVKISGRYVIDWKHSCERSQPHRIYMETKTPVKTHQSQIISYNAGTRLLQQIMSRNSINQETELQSRQLIRPAGQDSQNLLSWEVSCTCETHLSNQLIQYKLYILVSRAQFQRAVRCNNDSKHQPPQYLELFMTHTLNFSCRSFTKDDFLLWH